MTKVRVKGPNGLVYALDETLAASLVGGGKRGYEYVQDESESKAPAKKATAKRSSSK